MSSLYGSRGPMQSRTGAAVGNRTTGSNALGTSTVPRGYEMGQLQQFTPEQMDLFKQLFSQTGSDSQLSKLAMGDQSQFEQLEAPAMKQFGQLQSSIANRFAGLGTGGESSGHAIAQNSAAQDFAERLQANRMGLQRQAQQDLFGLSRDLLGQRPFENFLVPQQKPWWQEALIGLGPGLGQAVGAGVTGGVGALGSSLGPMLQKLFSSGGM